MLGELIQNRREALRSVAGLALAAGASGTAIAQRDGDQPTDTATRDQPACDRRVPGDHDTIQGAVDAAGVGETVCVAPGTYEEALRLGVRGLTIRASDARAATIDASGENLAVTADARGVSVEGFEIVGDDETRAGVSVRTSQGATDNVTIANNHIHGMAMPGGGGISESQCWGVIAWGNEPIGRLTVEDNLITSIGGSPDDLPVGTAVDLKDVQGSAPGEGAVVRRNAIRNVADGRFGFFGSGIDLPGTGISVQPSDGEQSGAGAPATIIEGNEISGVSMDVALGETGQSRLLDNG